MSTLSGLHGNFAPYRTQTESAAQTQSLRGHRRFLGWSAAVVVSLGLWGAVVAGVIALVHLF